jgi:hypothetical protein
MTNVKFHRDAIQEIDLGFGELNPEEILKRIKAIRHHLETWEMRAEYDLGTRWIIPDRFGALDGKYFDTYDEAFQYKHKVELEKYGMILNTAPEPIRMNREVKVEEPIETEDFIKPPEPPYSQLVDLDKEDKL